MKILMIAPQPFFQPRGTPISVYQRLHGLSALGHEVDLVTYHVGNEVNIPGVCIHRTPPVPFIKNVKVGPSWSKLLLDILLICQAVTMLLKNRYDVIHSHEEAGFFAALLATLFRKYHIYDMHSILPRQLVNFDFGNYRLMIKLFEKLERWVVHTCDAMITIGTDLEEYVEQINPQVKQAMIENLPINADGVTKADYTAEELKAKLGVQNRVLIVYTGTFERYQGLDLLFESIKIVKQKYPAVSFIFVGGKPHQVEYWRDRMKSNDLEDWTLFVGTVSPSEALAYLDLADVLVSPRTEGLSVPLKIYTYLYSGKPIVATKLFAHTQVLNDNMAVVVEPEKEAFAEGLIKLIKDPDLRSRLGHEARNFAAEKYNLKNYLTKLEGIYTLFQPFPSVSDKQIVMKVKKINQ